MQAREKFCSYYNSFYSKDTPYYHKGVQSETFMKTVKRKCAGQTSSCKLLLQAIGCGRVVNGKCSHFIVMIYSEK